MPTFQSIEATAMGASIHVRLRLDRPRALAWQVLDPTTGALLSDGERREAGGEMDLCVDLPPEDGPYRLHVAPQDDGDRILLIDASITGGLVKIETPRGVSLSALRRSRF